MDDGIEVNESDTFPFAAHSERIGEVSPKLWRCNLSMNSFPASLVGISVFVVLIKELAFL
jgi:hypothetical protein